LRDGGLRHGARRPVNERETASKKIGVAHVESPNT
jgi:hypothetical protein